MAAVVSGNGLGLFNSSLQSGLAAGGIDRLGAQASDRHFVNVANGNLVLSSGDEQLLFRGMMLGHVRTYNSQGLASQVGDDGWLTGFERRVELLSGMANTAGSIVRLHVGDGSFQDFTYDGNGGYRSTSGEGAHDTLVYSSATRSWTYVEGTSRREETYADHASPNLKGRLTRIRDLRSDAAMPVTWDVLYDGAGRISQIRSKDTSAGATPDALVFTYDSNGRLSGLSTRENGVLLGQVNYGYDAVGRLTSVLVDLTPRDGAGDQDAWNAALPSANDGYLYRTVYTYADSSSLRISQVKQGDGSTVSYTYDTQGRVATVTTGDVNGAHSTLTYSYDPANARTDVSEDGGRTWSYFHNDQGQLTEIRSPAVDGLRNVSRYNYDQDGNLTQAITLRGNQRLSQVDYQYDSNGNLLWQWTAVDPDNSAASTAVQRTYTATHQIASETAYSGLDADGAGAASTASGGVTTSYVYDAQNRLRFLVGAAGDVTERIYHASGTGIGQLASERRYLGSAFSGTPTLSSLEAWGTSAQRSSSGLVEYSYDLRGRLSQTRAFDAVDQDGSGLIGDGTEITDFVHDAQGLLRKRTVVRHANGAAAADGHVSQSTSFAYDGMGRLLAEVVQERWTSPGQTLQVKQLRSTTWTYQDSGSAVRASIEAGRAGDGSGNDLLRVELRNAAGQLIAVTESVMDGTGTPHSTQHYYDASGQLRASEDANGSRIYFFYDEAGRLAGKVSATGSVEEYVRDGLGRIITTIGFANQITTAGWLVNGAVVLDRLGDIRPAQDAQDRRTTSSYDAIGRKLQDVDPEGTITTYSYDGAGRLLTLTRTDAAATTGTARIERHLYDGAGREVGRLDAAGYLTEFRYDSAGRLVATVVYAVATAEPNRATGSLDALRPQSSGADAITYRFYDGRSNLIGSLDAEGYLTEYVYDQARNQRGTIAYATQLSGVSLQGGFSALLAAAKQGPARTVLRSYDALGQLVVEVSPEGVVTRFTYDAQGHLVQTRSDAMGNDVRDGIRRYDAFGNLVGELNGEGASLYDAELEPAEIDALFASYGVRHTYDAVGQRIESIDAEGNRTWYFYDRSGRLTQTIYGVTDGNGVRNAMGEVEETRYSAFGQVLETLRYSGRIALQPPFGREQAEVAALALQFVATVDSRRQYQYDRAGRLIEQSSALGFKTRSSYNAFGELVLREEQRSASSWTVEAHAYDQRGLQVSSTQDVGGLERTKTAVYDAFGRVLYSVDGQGLQSNFSYDRVGRQVAVGRTVAGRLEQAQTLYDAYGRTLKTVDALGRVTEFSYDDTARTMTVTSPEGLSVVTHYNAHGERIEMRRPDGYVRRFDYDKEGRLIGDGLRRDEYPEWEFEEKVHYSYDARGNLIEKGDFTGARTTYTYDARGRELTRTDDGYTRDQNTGESHYDVGAHWSYRYDGQGRRISVTDGAGVQTVMVHDLDGRLLESVVDPAGLAITTRYAWDGLGNQLSVTEAAGTAAESTTLYAYDGLGRRISETRAAGNLDLTTQYTFDSRDNVVSRRDAAGNVTRFAYDDAGRLLLEVDALGGVVEYRYDVAGQKTSSRQYGTVIDLQGLALPAGEQEIRARIVVDAARDRVVYHRYDADGRQTVSVDAAGAVTRYIRDSQGGVAQTRTYAQGLTLGAAQREALESGVLDAGGILATVVSDDTRDRIDSYLRDGSGREQIHVDSAGAVFQTAYDQAGRTIGTWIMQSRAPFSLHEQIASGQEPDLSGIDWSKGSNHAVDYMYDAAGRLVAKLTWANSIDGPYDYDGKANVARVQRYVYDEAGRATATIDYGVGPKWYFPTFMAAAPSRPSALFLSGERQWSSIEDLLAAIAQNTDGDVPQRTTRHIYDDAGRERFRIASDGTVQEMRPDALGRNVEVLSYGAVVQDQEWTADALEEVLAGVQDVRHSRQEFDAAGRVTARFDAFNAVERYTYDGLGQVLQYTDKNLATWTYGYDAAGRRTSETSPQVVVSTVAADGSVGSVSRSIVTRTEFDIFGNVVRRIEDAGTSSARVTEYEYDSRGLQTRTRFPDAGVLNGSGQIAATGVRPTIDVTYDLLGRAVMQKDVLGNFSFKSYDSAGNLQYEVDAEGYVTGYTYNTAGEQIELRRYANAIATSPGVVLGSGDIAGRLSPEPGRDRILITRYDSAGKKLQVSELNYRQGGWQNTWNYFYGSTKKFEYNTYGELVYEGDLLVDPGSYEYDPEQYESFSWTYTQWNQNAYFYDSAGRRIKRIDSEGYVTLWEYNDRGEVVRETQKAEVEGYWPYDGRQGSSKAPTSIGHDRIIEWSYDALGRRISERQSRGAPADGQFVETTTEYDAGGRAVAVTAQGQRTQTSYDAQGRVIAVLESERDVVNGNADQLLASTSISLAGQALYRRASPYSTMAYDAFGNVVQVRRYADGAEAGQTPVASSRDQVHTTLYDWQGRNVLERDVSGTVYARRYDAADHLLSTRSRLDGSSGRWAEVVNEATYDRTGRQLTSHVYRELHQGHGSAVVGVESDARSQVRYNAFGEIIAKDSRLDTGLATSAFSAQYVYDDNGRLTASNADGGIWRYYSHDLAGNVLSERHAVRDGTGALIEVETRMELDHRGRLLRQYTAGNTDEVNDYALTERSYDAWGNVLTLTDALGNMTYYEYNQLNQLTREVKPTVRVLAADGSVSQVAPELQWQYDLLGRLTATRDANGNWKRSAYDAAGRETYAEDAFGNRTLTAYDVFGQKRFKQDPLGYLTFLEYDQGGRVSAQGDFLREQDGVARTKAVRERYVLNQNGDRLRVTDALGYANTFDYDSRGLVIRSRTAAGVSMSYAYDAQGNRTRETNALSDPTLAADGQVVFAGGMVDSHAIVVGQPFNYALPSQVFIVAGGEVPTVSARVEFWDPVAHAYVPAQGLIYDPQTRTVSGTPLQLGAYRIVYTATSSVHTSATATATLNVMSQSAFDSYYAGSPGASAGLFNQKGQAGQSFSYQIPAGTFIDTQGQGLSYAAYVYAPVEQYDPELREHTTSYEWIVVGQGGESSGLGFNAANGVLSGTLAAGTWQIQIVATSPNGRSRALTLEIEGQYNNGRRSKLDDEGELVYLDEKTWDFDYFGRLVDHNDLSGADYDYNYDAQTGQLLGENSKWTEDARQYSTPINDYWYERDWREQGLDSELVGLDLPDPVLINDPARSYSYYRSGALKELKEGSNWFRYQYDAAGNRVQEEAYTHDADGQTLHIVTKVSYDAHGRIVKVIQHDIGANRRLLELNYDYDAAGNRRRVLARSAYDATSPGIDINGLTNPDFENGSFGWNLGDGWSVVEGGEGSSKLRAQFNLTGQSRILNKQRVEVREGETLTAAVRVDQGASSAGEAGAAVIIEWYDLAGNLISTSEGNMVDSASGGAVYESRVTTTVPPGAIFMSIGARAFRTGGGDPLFIDNFSWGAMPYNGEMRNVGGWDYGAGWDYSYDYGGSAVFNLTGEGRMVSRDRVNVRPGSSVSARANVQQGASSAGEAWGAVFLRFYDANGNVISDVDGNRVDSGSGGEWHSSMLVARVPPGAVSMAVGGVAARYGGGDALWMDDFSWNFEREGDLDPTGNFVDPNLSDPYNMPEPFKVYWYDYDAENRVKVANGRMVDGHIVLGNADVSYALDYDEAGRAVRRRYLAGLTEVSETTQYDERGQRLRVFQSVPLNGSGPLGLKESYSYDAVGRVIEKREHFANGSTRNGVDTSGWLKHGEVYTYDADGRILNQQVYGRQLGWTAGAQADGGAWQSSNLAALQNLAAVDYQAFGYDEAGRLRGYSYRYSQHEEGSGAQASDPKGYTHRYIYAYEARDSYLESRIYGSSSNQNFRASTSYSSYDAWGRRVAVREQTPLSNDLGKLDDRIRYFSFDATGNILRRREGSLSNGVFTQSAAQQTQTQLYAYVGGQLVASGKRNGDVDVVGRLTAYQSNSAAGSSRTTVLAGETLRGIAQRAYGNANLWYVLAEANAIADDSGLTAGTTLVVPEVQVTSNDAATFKPFNPQEAIGNTSPSLPYIEPPPKEHCNGIAMVLMVIVAVVATVFTAGAAAVAFGAVAAGTGAFAAGAAVLTGTAMAAATGFAATAAVAGAAFVGGMAGSIASQAVGKAMGVVDSFSLRSAVGSGLGAAAGAGIAGAIGGGAQVSELIQAGSYGRVAAIGAANAAAGYAAGKIAGVADTHFSWRAIAANAVSSVVSGKINQKLGTSVSPYVANGIVNDTIGGMAGGVVSLHVRRTFGLADDINYGAIAADAFGNALGNSFSSWSASAGRYASPTREGISLQPGAPAIVGGGSPISAIAPPSLSVVQSPTASSVGAYATDATTLETVHVTARPYGDGWYFYRWDSANTKWIDLQRPPQQAASRLLSDDFGWMNGYGVSQSNSKDWRMAGLQSTSTASNLPGLVNRGFSAQPAGADFSQSMSALSDGANKVNFWAGITETAVKAQITGPAAAMLMTDSGVHKQGILTIVTGDVQASAKMYGPYADVSHELTRSVNTYGSTLKGVAVVGKVAQVVDGGAFIMAAPQGHKVEAGLAVTADAVGSTAATTLGGVAGGAAAGAVFGSYTGPLAPYAVPVGAAGGAILAAFGWDKAVSPMLRSSQPYSYDPTMARPYWGMPATAEHPVVTVTYDPSKGRPFWGAPASGQSVPLRTAPGTALKGTTPAQTQSVPWYSDPEYARPYWGMPAKH